MFCSCREHTSERKKNPCEFRNDRWYHDWWLIPGKLGEEKVIRYGLALQVQHAGLWFPVDLQPKNCPKCSSTFDLFPLWKVWRISEAGKKSSGTRPFWVAILEANLEESPVSLIDLAKPLMLLRHLLNLLHLYSRWVFFVSVKHPSWPDRTSWESVLGRQNWEQRAVRGEQSRYVKICEDMWRYVKICEDMWRYVKICQDMWRYVKICQDMWRYVKICQDMWRYVKICQDMSRYVKI